MNKLIAAILAGTAISGAAYAAQDDGLFEKVDVLASVSFESEYVFRGVQLADEVIQPSVELRSGPLYGGVWASVPLESEYSEEINLYAGYGFNISDKLHLDLGYMYYWYVNDNDAIDFANNPGGQGFGYDFRNEVYAGLYADVIGRPQGYLYYDFELDQLVIEFSAGHSYSLEKVHDSLRNASIDLGGYVGLVDSGDVNSDQNAGSPENGYTYWGVTADLSYRFRDGLAGAIGVRYSGNNDDRTNTVVHNTFQPDKESNFWWGASIAAGF